MYMCICRIYIYICMKTAPPKKKERGSPVSDISDVKKQVASKVAFGTLARLSEWGPWVRNEHWSGLLEGRGGGRLQAVGASIAANVMALYSS